MTPKLSFRSIPRGVAAVQWFIGLVPDDCEIISDPKKCVGVHGVHIGHQRELDGTNAIVHTSRIDHFNGGWELIGEGDWIVWTPSPGGGSFVNVFSDAEFRKHFEPDVAARSPVLKLSLIENAAPDHGDKSVLFTESAQLSTESPDFWVRVLAWRSSVLAVALFEVALHAGRGEDDALSIRTYVAGAHLVSNAEIQREGIRLFDEAVREVRTKIPHEHWAFR